jgi:hypothetical protein
MARMRHDNPRAALIYQHTSAEADQTIVDAVSAKVVADCRKAKDAAKKTSKPARAAPLGERPEIRSHSQAGRMSGGDLGNAGSVCEPDPYAQSSGEAFD